MVMVGHTRRLAEPLRIGRRDRVILAAVAACAAIAVGVLIAVAALQGGAHLRSGCVQAVTASYVGGGTVRACGADARTLCRSAAGGAPGSAQAAIAAACRRSRVPSGP